MTKNYKERSKAEQRKITKEKIKKRNQSMIISVVVIVVIVITFYLASMGATDNEREEFNPVLDSNEISETQIGIPLSSIGSTATFYTYHSNGVDVVYFAVRGSDGEIHVALDACDVCFEAKKGYRQNDNVMECINCGLTFPIKGIGSDNKEGGCWPSFIPIIIENDTVIIETEDLDNKRFMFI